jgi:hypothetical protein
MFKTLSKVNFTSFGSVMKRSFAVSVAGNANEITIERNGAKAPEEMPLYFDN